MTLFFIGSMNASTCEMTLQRSVDVTDKCLDQLESIEKRIGSNGKYNEEYVVSLKRKIERLAFLNRYLLKNLPEYIIDYKMKTADVTYMNQDKSTTELLQNNLYRVPVHSLNIREGHSPKTKIVSVLQRDDIVPFTEIYHSSNKERDIFWLKIDLGWIYITDSYKAEVLNMLIEKSKNAMKQPHLSLSNLLNGKGGAKG